MNRYANNPKTKQQGNLRSTFSALLALLIIFATPAHAVITINFNYTDPAGVGFNAADPLGAARKTALVQTGVLFSNLFPAYNATLNIDVDGMDTVGLASAGSTYSQGCPNPNVGFTRRGDVGVKMLGGADPDPTRSDGSISVNFTTIIWDYDDTITPGQFDFKSTLLHELLHAAGYFHSIREPGTDSCNNAEPTPGFWTPYDQHLGNNMLNFINGAFVINTAAWNTAKIGGTNTTGTLWRGANAMAANAGNPVPLFSPNPFSGGSSISHLDDTVYNGTLLMEAETGPGPGIRTLSPIEQGILQDIGFVASAATCTGQTVSITSPGTTTGDSTPTYSWNALPCADQYFLWIVDNGFNTQFAQYVTSAQAGCAGGTGTCSFTPATVLNPTGAYMTMIPYNNNSATYGNWVPWRSFDVCNAIPAVVTLISPQGVIGTNNPTYSWNASTGTAWYNLYLINSTGAAQVFAWYTASQASCASGTGTCSVTPVGAPQSGDRVWYIAPYNQCGGVQSYSAGLFFRAP